MEDLKQIKDFCKEQIIKIDNMEVFSSYFEGKQKAFNEVIDYIDSLNKENV